ncbi:ABC transporter permease [Inconstantimicrobium mannanitabidum]|uniref:Uncharacterized protein n=1 Tax=Inconstantimicrobium mannanitabidum TaxID=1604901 RepID=A0ACB5RIG7_9CLOT|nr:ABC transporter permease [Clostridium sp. TW13]GKX68921.1 hypothetical protein rsdtw13_41790 [Clostridium sp. TW13]
MNNIKYAIEGLVRRPLLFLIILLQVIIGTMLLNKTLVSVLNIYDTNKRVVDTFKGKELYKMQDNSDMKYIDESLDKPDGFNRAYELYTFFKENKDFSILHGDRTNAVVGGIVDNDKFFYSKKNKYTDISGKFYSVVTSYNVDENYIKQFPLKISKGRSFSSADFDSEFERPVILGSGYKKYYDVGQVFKCYDYYLRKEISLKVVGILDDSNYAVDIDSPFALDDMIIMPLQNLNSKTAKKDSYITWFMNCMVSTSNKTSTLNSIRDKCDKLKLYNFSLISCDQRVQELLAGLKEDLKSSIIVSVIIFLFICIAIITIQINSIRDRLSELGIHLLSGGCKKDISKRLVYSISAYIIAGIGIAEYFNYLSIKNSSSSYERFDVRIIYLAIPIAVVLIIVTSIMPLMEIRKMDISTIMRRKE